MAIESKFKRIEREDDPNRCQAVHGKGQCIYLSTENSKYCPMHGGAAAENAHAKVMKRKYQLAQWTQRVGEFADDDQVKSLREEIGILRMTLEQVVRQCKTDTDVLLWSGKIGDLVTKIEKVVTSCNRLEVSSGMLLDKSAALNLASQVVEIIARHVTDADAVDDISNDIIQVIVGINSTEST